MLNSQQKKAVEILDKPVVVIAGPGTGKTALISEKINHLFNNGFKEDEVLALTFTQKAAEEMSSRVEGISNKIFSAKTFHSFALELIEIYQKEFAILDSGYKLIDEMNSYLFFVENLESLNLKSVQIKNNHNSVASDLESSVLRLKEFGISLNDAKKLEFQNEDLKEDILNAYLKYEEYKQRNNFIDFSDLLLYVLDLLKNNSKVRKEIIERYKYILVDEFQDTNKVQFEILKLISNDTNITIVGDPKQSIYSFRGVFRENFSEFKSYFQNFEEIFLFENYRASKRVLDSINDLTIKISNENELLTGNVETVGDARVIETLDEESSSKYIFTQISHIEKLNPNATIGILCRRKSELREISYKLKFNGVKHNSLQVLNFFNQEIVRELILYLKIIDSPIDSNNELFKYLQNSGLRFETIKSISRKSSLKDKSIYNVLFEENLSDYESEILMLNSIRENLVYLSDLKNMSVSIENLVFEVIARLNFYQKAVVFENTENIFLLNKFLEFTKSVSGTHKSISLKRFIQICELSKNSDALMQDEVDMTSNKITLLTVHQAKGKEFDYVFIPYLNDRKFPSQHIKSRFPLPFDTQREEFICEERRVFFVALSRAKIEVNFIYVKRYSDNKFDSKPSEFLSSLKLEKEIFVNSKLDIVNTNISDTIKLELIQKINSALILGQYDDAKVEIDVLKSLFSKKDLTSFLSENNNSRVLEYKKKIEVDSFEKVSLDVKNTNYSVSRLKLYESCPRKYLYSYVYKIPTPSKHFFDFGTSVHSVLENLSPMFDSNMQKEIIYANAISMLHKSWISKGYENATQEKEYFQKGLVAIKSFIEKEMELRKQNREVVALEKEFLIEIGGKKILGFIDRIDKIDGEYEIIDYKTSNSMETVEQLNENLQLYVYSIALKELYDKYPSKVGLWYLVFDKLLQVKINLENIDKIKAKILELIEGIENNRFSPKPSFFNCTYCDFSNICDFSCKK